MRYEATYKGKLDRDLKWRLGIRPNKEAALAALNKMPNVPGTFSFDNPTDEPVAQGYVLIEWEEGKQFPTPNASPALSAEVSGTPSMLHSSLARATPQPSFSCLG